MQRLTFSAYDDTVDAPQASLDPERWPPSAESARQPASICDAALLCCPAETVLQCFAAAVYNVTDLIPESELLIKPFISTIQMIW